MNSFAGNLFFTESGKNQNGWFATVDNKDGKSELITFNIYSNHFHNTQLDLLFGPPLCFKNFILLLRPDHLFELRAFDGNLIKDLKVETNTVLGMFERIDEENAFCFVETTFKDKKGRHQLTFAKIENEMIKIFKHVEIPFPGRPIKVGKFIHIINTDGRIHKVSM